MLAISGEKKMVQCTSLESPDSINYSVDNGVCNSKKSVDEYETNSYEPVTNKLCYKEKVERLIDCMKKQQEMKQMNNQDKSHISHKNTGSSFQNRFKAQKDIIDMQKNKLLEQEKIINELKMGILSNEDMYKKDKFEIRELFHDCKMKLIGRVPLDYIPKEQGLLVKTQKAPKIIQELERRAMERMKYREMIKERKKKIEETRKLQQEQSKKRQMEAEEKSNHLEMLRERHRKEQQRMKIRQFNKEIFLKKLNRAIIFHEKKLVKRLFTRWKYYYISSLNNCKMSQEYYRRKVYGKFFSRLREIGYSKYSLKCEKADTFLKKMLFRKGWRTLRENHMDGIRSWQVAEDFNDFLIERNVLRYLFRFTSKEKILRDIKTQQACYHYDRKLLFYSFFHWKSLPIVLKMEQVKEERKQKWRKKVLEILPDFNPAEISYNELKL